MSELDGKQNGRVRGAELVNGWTTRPLGDTCAVFTDGDWIETKDQSPEGVRLIQTGNVGEGVFKSRDEKARYISNATFQRLKCTEIFESDCLISRLPDPVGRSCILPDTGELMITAVDCTIVRFYADQVIPNFFNYYSQSHHYLKDVNSETTGTTRRRISRSKLGQIPIPVPPLPEQRRIVAILDEAFTGIATARANAERNLRNARALFESHLEGVFSRRGKGWVETALGKAFDVRDGTHDSPKYHEAGYPLITSKNLKREGLSFEKVKYINERDYNQINKRSAVHKGDVLLAMIGTIGNPTVITIEPKFAIKNVALFKVPSRQCGYFLKYYLCSRYVSSKMIREARGTTQKFVSLAYLRNFPIRLPSYADQRMIAEQLEEFGKEIDRLETLYQRKLAALDELKKSLLDRAFSGRL